MLEKHETSDEKAYLIRNVNKIENPTEFFELISKTSSTVICTADGLVVNHNIELSPLAYNEIGKQMFNDRLNQISNADLANNVGVDFSEEIPVDKREKFRTELDEIKKLPYAKRKAATQELINEFSGGDDTKIKDLNQKFNEKWDKAQKELNGSLNKLITDFSQDVTDEAKEKDFHKLRELAIKRIEGTITLDERNELEKAAACSRHRKEYFFESSKCDDLNTDLANKIGANFLKDIPEDEREKFLTKLDEIKNLPYDQRKVKTMKLINDFSGSDQTEKFNEQWNGAKQKLDNFKKGIDTFTNGRCERLCFRINVDEMKQKLLNITQQQELKSFTVKNNTIFSNMKTSDYDRLNRVYNESGKAADDLFKASLSLANDSDFGGEVKTPNDIASIVEAIKSEKEVFLYFHNNSISFEIFTIGTIIIY